MASQTKVKSLWPATDGGKAGPGTERRPYRRRRLPLVAAGLVLVGLSVAVFAALVPRAPHARAVLVAARPIRAGQAINPGDVRVAELASSAVAGIGVAERGRVLGRLAAFDVAPGQPLVAADVGGPPGPAPGEAIVGVALAPGRLPDRLAVGDSVVVLSTPAAGPGGAGSAGGQPAGSAPGELARARVFALGSSPDGSRLDVSLVVPAGSADAVAAAAAAGSVSVVWVAR
jgi:hypothetical protein